MEPLQIKGRALFLVYLDENGDVYTQFDEKLTSLERKGVLQTLSELVDIEKKVLVQQQLEED